MKNEHDLEEDPSDATLTATAGDVSGYFAWASVVDVDGATVEVLADVHEDTSSADEDEGGAYREVKLTLNYPGGDLIVHDPVLGVQTASLTSGGDVLGIPSAGLLATVGAVAAVGLAASRRR